MQARAQLRGKIVRLAAIGLWGGLMSHLCLRNLANARGSDTPDLMEVERLYLGGGVALAIFLVLVEAMSTGLILREWRASGTYEGAPRLGLAMGSTLALVVAGAAGICLYSILSIF